MTSHSPQNILLIGGSRFVGPYLVDALRSRGHAITIINRGRLQSAYPEGVRFIKADRNSGFTRFHERFDAVIDICAFVGHHTARALRELKFGFFVHMSTAAVYRKGAATPLSEDSPLGDWPAFGVYNKGKVECERVLAAGGAPYASLRPVYILGPKNYIDRERFIYNRIHRAVPFNLPGDGEAIVQFVFADEVAASLALLAEVQKTGAYNCAGDEVITLRQLVEMMGAIVGKKPVIQYRRSVGVKQGPDEFPFPDENLVVSNRKIKELGASFAPLRRRLTADYRRYYRAALELAPAPHTR